MKKVFTISLLFISLVLLAGCMPDPRIELKYVPSPFESMIGEGKTVALAPIIDDRPEQRWVAADYNGIGNPVKTHITKQPLEVYINQAIKDHFEAAGFTVTQIPYWDLTEDGIKDIGTDLLAGGKIRVFWAESHPNVGTNNLTGWGNSSAKIDLVIASPEQKKILWAGSISSYHDRQLGLFAERLDMEKFLNEELSIAVDGFLRNKAVLEVLTEIFKSK